MSPMIYTTDTSPEAYAVQLDCIRRMSPAERFRRMCRMSSDVRQMAFDAIRRRHPDYDDSEVRLRFLELTYGRELADQVRDHLREQGIG